MQRRRFLVSATAGSALLAGCLSFFDEDESQPIATESAPQGNDTGDRSSTDESKTPSEGIDLTEDEVFGERQDEGSEDRQDEGSGGPQDGGSGERGEETFWTDLEKLPTFDEPTVVSFETAPITAVATGGFRTGDGIRGQVDFVTGASRDSPARLTVVLANTRPWEQTVRSDRLLVLDDPSFGYNADRDAVYLAPTASHPIVETVPEYDLDSEGRWRVQSVREEWFPDTVTFPPESGFVAEHRLLGHYQRDEPAFAPGRYGFSSGDAELTIVAWETDAPGPDRRSGFAGVTPPALPRADRMAWFHEATPKTGTFLRPDTEVVELPATITFEFVNHSDRSAGGNPYYWRVYKHVDSEWFPVAPWAWNQPYVLLEPGARERSQLALFNGRGIDDREKRVLDYVGGGTYAYESGYAVDGETHAAMFEIDAPAVVVEPEDGAAITDQGDRLVVELPNRADARRPATFTVTRADGSEPDDRLIPEQLPRRPLRAYRNALPLFEAGVGAVQVETDRATALEPFDYEESAERIVEYRGETYRATADLHEG